jgi:hypothetical protein
MDRRPTPDPGSTETVPETVRGEPDYAATRRRLEQQPIAENEGLATKKTREPARSSDIEANPASEEREAAAQRGRAAN